LAGLNKEHEKSEGQVVWSGTSYAEAQLYVITRYLYRSKYSQLYRMANIQIRFYFNSRRFFCGCFVIMIIDVIDETKRGTVMFHILRYFKCCFDACRRGV